MDERTVIAGISVLGGAVGTILTFWVKNLFENRAELRKSSLLEIKEKRQTLAEGAALLQEIKDQIRFKVLPQDSPEGYRDFEECLNRLSHYYITKHASLSSMSIQKRFHHLKNISASLMAEASSNGMEKDKLEKFLIATSELHVDVISTLVLMESLYISTAKGYLNLNNRSTVGSSKGPSTDAMQRP